MKLKSSLILALPLLVALSSGFGLADPAYPPISNTPPTPRVDPQSSAPSNNANAPSTLPSPAPVAPGYDNGAPTVPIAPVPTPVPPPARRLLPMGLASMLQPPTTATPAAPGTSPAGTTAPGATSIAPSTSGSGYEPVFPPDAQSASYLPVSKATKRNYALMWAAYDGATSRARDLIAQGANIEARDWQYGFTPLLWASENGRLGTVRYLLSKGAKVNVKSNAGIPVMLAVSPFKITPTTAETQPYSNGQDIIALALYIEAYRGGVTPLVMASAQGYGMTARALLDKGADPNLGTADHITPLICAAFTGYMPSIHALLDKGAKLDATDAYYDYPLLMAAGRGNTSLVRFFLTKGSNPNLVPSPGIVSNFALKYGHVATARVVREAEIKRFAADAAKSKAQTSMVGDQAMQITPDAGAKDLGIIILR